MTDLPLLPRRRCEELFSAVQSVCARSGIRDVEVFLAASDESLTRFANNEIHQSVAELTHTLSIRIVTENRTARVSTNRVERNGIESAVQAVIALARASEPDPEMPPLYTGPAAPGVDRWSATTGGYSPADRASGIKEALGQTEGLTAAGIFATQQSAEALLNSTGVFQYYADSLAQFSITAMAPDSSGWAKATDPDVSRIDAASLAAQAARKARLSAAPKRIDPGRYTVILEPAAVLDLAGQIFADFSGTALQDHRSFLNDRMDTQLFGENIHITDDVYHALQTGAPWDGEGVTRSRLTLVDKGVPRQVAWSRAAAQRAGQQPTGHGFALPNEHGESPGNIVIHGGDASLDSLISSTENGVLVTRLWYIRETEPYEKIMTGMTRDGTFLVRDGQVVHGLRNFRFNQSVVEMLRNVDALSRPVRASGEESFDMVVPAMRVRDFHFTEVTAF